jgi:hypothetical protein
MDENWLETAKQLHHSGKHLEALSAAVIGILEGFSTEWVYEEQPEVIFTGGYPEREERRQADDMTHLVWDSR